MTLFDDIKRKGNNLSRNLRNTLHEHREVELLILLLLVIILPPVAVFIMEGMEVPFFVCLALTIFWFFPGMAYATFLLGRYSTTLY